ncbi:MAG: hypothetical protein DRH93_12110 [Deltaproteobacteria bacterium]|nr:MAG: hypothetical protein DRH93_12110 [Deltaproteobacteria bacterium]
MNFQTTPTGYEKTIVSDLQGAWSIFREAVAATGGFKGAGDVLFHTDEAMSWEVVRSLKLMPPLILTIRNLCNQGKAPEEILQYLNMINEILEKTLEIYPE